MKGIKTTLLLVLTFAVLWLPETVTMIIQNVTGRLDLDDVWQNMFAIMVACTPLADICIYAIRNKHVKSTFRTKQQNATRWVSRQAEPTVNCFKHRNSLTGSFQFLQPKPNQLMYPLKHISELWHNVRSVPYIVLQLYLILSLNTLTMGNLLNTIENRGVTIILLTDVDHA